MIMVTIIALITCLLINMAIVVNMLIIINLTSCFCKCLLNAKSAFSQMSKLAHYKALHDSWCHFIFCYVG
jgi:hypothetical protein